MDLNWVILLLLDLCAVFAEYVEIQRHHEMEKALFDPDGFQRDFWVWRSEASGLKTLRLVDSRQRYLVLIKICIEPVKESDFVTIHLDDIRYANDGPYDVIFVSFDNEPWSVYSTFEKWAHGHEWNIFRNTGRNGEPKKLPKGEYFIGISVQTDKWGIELDKIRLIAEYQTLNSKLFCGTTMFDRGPDFSYTDDELFHDD